MKFAGNISLCVAGVMTLIPLVHAEELATTGNPYTPIVTRNVFGLNPPAPELPPVVEMPVKITPNGIMSIFGQLQVLFKTSLQRPGQPPKEESYVLSEGQRQDDIEVTRIDEKAGMITFNNHGTLQQLPLANAAATTGGMPKGMPNGGMIPMPIRPNPNAGIPHPTGPTGRSSFFGRDRTVTTGGGQGNSPSGPSFPNRFSNQNNQSAQQLTPEARVILMEAQRAQWQSTGTHNPAIIPPTPLTPENSPSSIGGPPAP